MQQAIWIFQWDGIFMLKSRSLSERSADGIDSTRVAFGVADEFGNTRPAADGVINVTLHGPGKIVGDTTFDLTDSGAVGAVWIRGVPGQHGSVQLTVSHPAFESKSVIVDML